MSNREVKLWVNVYYVDSPNEKYVIFNDNSLTTSLLYIQEHNYKILAVSRREVEDNEAGYDLTYDIIVR